jgi:hypothetical protein
MIGLPLFRAEMAAETKPSEIMSSDPTSTIPQAWMMRIAILSASAGRFPSLELRACSIRDRSSRRRRQDILSVLGQVLPDRGWEMGVERVWHRPEGNLKSRGWREIKSLTQIKVGGEALR